MNELFQRIRDVTAEAMVEVANEWLIPERRTTLFVLPDRSAVDQ